MERDMARIIEIKANLFLENSKRTKYPGHGPVWKDHYVATDEVNLDFWDGPGKDNSLTALLTKIKVEAQWPLGLTFWIKGKYAEHKKIKGKASF